MPQGDRGQRPDAEIDRGCDSGGIPARGPSLCVQGVRDRVSHHHSASRQYSSLTPKDVRRLRAGRPGGDPAGATEFPASVYLQVGMIPGTVTSPDHPSSTVNGVPAGPVMRSLRGASSGSPRPRLLPNGCGRSAPVRISPGMGTVMTNETSQTDESLLRRAADGEGGALAELFSRYRERLRRMVRLRLDRRLQGRVDPSDVLQDAYLDLDARLPEYALDPRCRLPLAPPPDRPAALQVHRRHLGAAMRDAGREVSLYRGPLPQASSVSLAAQLLGRLTSASLAARPGRDAAPAPGGAQRAWTRSTARSWRLRHFEELTNGEAAEVLGLTKTAASNRYIRALRRLRAALEAIPEFLADASTGGDLGACDRASAQCPGREPKEAIMTADADLESDDPVERLAEEFLDRHRRGERPTVAEYAERAPRAGRGDPRALPGPAADGGAQARLGRPDGRVRPGGAATRAGPGSERLGDYRSSARWAGAAWGSSTRPSRSRSGRHVALKVLPGARPARPAAAPAGSTARPGRRPGCTTPTSCRSSASASRTACTTTSCSSSRARGSTRCSTSCERLAARRRAVARAGLAPVRSLHPVGDAARSLITGGHAAAPRGDGTGWTGIGRPEPDSVETRSADPLPSARPCPGIGAVEPVRLGDGRYARSVARIGLQVAEALDYAHAAGDPPPRHQAVEPAARHPWHRLGGRLRPGQGEPTTTT